MKIKIGERVVEARTQLKSTTPSGNGYYVVVYSLEGETIYQHHTGCMAAAPSPVEELETVRNVWDPTITTGRWSDDKGNIKQGDYRKATVRSLIEAALAQVVD